MALSLLMGLKMMFMTLMTVNMTVNMTLLAQYPWAYDAYDTSSLVHAHARAHNIIHLSYPS